MPVAALAVALLAACSRGPEVVPPANTAPDS